MDLVRAVCSTALGLRKARKLRVRLPLASLVIAHPRGQVAGPVHRPDRRRGQRQDRRAGRRPGQPGHVRAGRQPPAARAPARRAGAGGHPRRSRRATGRSPGTASPRPGSSSSPASTSCGWPPPIPAPPRPCPAHAGLIALDTRVTPGAGRRRHRARRGPGRAAGAPGRGPVGVRPDPRSPLGADGAVADAVRAHAGFVAAETLAVEPGRAPGRRGQTARPQPAGDGRWSGQR